MNTLWNNLRMFLWLTLITGIIYPLIITGIAQFAMKPKADGGFISIDGKVVGAELIGQKFESNKYFWGRPSAVDYNPLPSGGSNLGPTSTALKKAVEDRRAIILKAHVITDKSEIPSELLFASGSGLDPHISPATAEFQVTRIITARGWDKKTAKDQITKLIGESTERPLLALLGEPKVNVLFLNLGLDKLDVSSKQR